MSITIKEMLSLESCRNFTPVAGQNNLSLHVDAIDMLDFGWERNEDYSSKFYDSHKIFDKRSFVISSLMFAHNNPEKLYNTILLLIECGVVGLAFKPAFFKELPEEVCHLADSNDFALFRIDDNIPYRKIIVDVSSAIRESEDISRISGYLYRMLMDNLDSKEVSVLASKISPYMQKYSQVTLIMSTEPEYRILENRIIQNFQTYEIYKNKAILCRFSMDTQDGLALITTLRSKDESKFDAIIKSALSACEIDISSALLAKSDIHLTYSNLDKCIKEAYTTLIALRVLNCLQLNYCQIGTLSYLIPLAGMSQLQEYMRAFLAPIMDNDEYIQTVTEFIRADGDYDIAATALHYHKNTLRYRINKIHSLLSPESSNEAFYENLSSAVKIYLILKNNI